MAEFQRSTTSFRRQGSSGLVWDDKFITGELNQKSDEEADANNKQQQASESTEPTPSGHRSRSSGGARGYRTVNVSPPTADPPSPKVSGCGLCGIFGKPVSSQNPKSNKRSRS
ncbi:hypothetical protein FEM48_Zijuj01G0199200 [Ziziphus jujuba var. spinosa]|uniref:MAPK kinase substrate protein At1g80180-like n=1 Tax=Ziziphus jujuba var. spinosa TaxID=714518 RepID=A0A978W388_ZIZJJ|nr:hypothetical protein FEM48_Zijuj01G0199200 [Ziziphus jujuba var. spinosa]